MEDRDAKLGRNLIIGIITLLVILILFSRQIPSLFQNDSLYASTSFFGLSQFQIFNLVFCLLFFSMFSMLGYRKAKQKNLNPVFWAFVCFVLNVWGYILLLFYKKKN
jgi:Na+-driven multidrug efflux pump